MGLLNLTPDKPFWGFPFPSAALDDFHFVGKDRRQNARVSPLTCFALAKNGFHQTVPDR